MKRHGDTHTPTAPTVRASSLLLRFSCIHPHAYAAWALSPLLLAEGINELVELARARVGRDVGIVERHLQLFHGGRGTVRVWRRTERRPI
eukprot:scaffold4501_cov108-Isochrysis_galbana.AAC.4